MKVLMSIKPEYANRIFSGEKRYEYRKSIFKNNNIKVVIVYATKPVGKVIGEFIVGEIICDSPDSIWKKTKGYSGIDFDDYNNYFVDRQRGFAIEIRSKELYENPIDLKDISPNLNNAPQSFVYV